MSEETNQPAAMRSEPEPAATRDEAESGGRMPVPPQEVVAAAQIAPDHWFFKTDPAWTGNGPPPNWAIVGSWRSGATGEIEEWEDNDDYRPSPEARGWPEPADPVDAAIQLAATGYGPGEEVPRALADAVVAVPTRADGEPVTAAVADGTPVVPVFTSPSYQYALGGLACEQMTVPELVNRLPEGHLLYVNPSGPAGMVLETEMLIEAMEGAE